MKTVRAFIDTNVLIYASDSRNSKKQEVAQRILGSTKYRHVISTQVLLEFFNSATRKLGADPLLARSLAQGFTHLETVAVDGSAAIEAMGTAILYQRTVWDAMIVEAAVLAKCERILSEDMQHGQVIKGVRIENPFLAA
ncbi:MAG TPA: PIN domain-containing protein [Fimbriimonas sp.]